VFVSTTSGSTFVLMTMIMMTVFPTVVVVVVAVPPNDVLTMVVVPLAAQPELVILLLSNETCPLYARARPFTLALVASVIDVKARMVPTKVVVVPIVAELVTCQKTLQA
jgi:hypothetical protein